MQSFLDAVIVFFVAKDSMVVVVFYVGVDWLRFIPFVIRDAGYYFYCVDEGASIAESGSREFYVISVIPVGFYLIYVVALRCQTQ